MTNFDRGEAIIQARKAFDTTEDEAVILEACARLIWYDDNNIECPLDELPKVGELVAWFRENHADKIMGTLPGFEFGRTTYGEWVDAQIKYPLHAFGCNLYLRDLTEYNRRELKAGRIPPMVRLRQDDTPEKVLKDFPAYLPIEAMRNQWLQAQEANLWPKDKPNPIRAVVKAWQNRPPEIDSTSIYDSKRPVTFMRHFRGNYDIELFSESPSDDAGSLKRFAGDVVLPESVQVLLPGIPRESVIRDPNKVMLAHVGGVPKSTRKGGVSPEVRIFVETIMQMTPNTSVARIGLKFGDLVERLYPNGFHWTNQASRLIEAIHNIDNLTVPFVNSSGRVQRGWAPVKLNTMEFSRRDDDIAFTVSLPKDAKKGPMVEKKYVRLLGLLSAPKWHAYLALCDLFYRHGVNKNKGGQFYLADPTKPVERRNERGYLLNARDEVIYGEKGQPLIELYDPDAVEQLDREANQRGIDKYPIVSFDDMLKACYPGRVYKNASEKAEYLRRAKQHFRELADLPSKAFGEKKGEEKAPHIIRIIEHADGWQFMPGQSHINAYRGVSYRGENTSDFSLKVYLM